MGITGISEWIVPLFIAILALAIAFVLFIIRKPIVEEVKQIQKKQAFRVSDLIDFPGRHKAEFLIEEICEECLKGTVVIALSPGQTVVSIQRFFSTENLVSENGFCVVVTNGKETYTMTWDWDDYYPMYDDFALKILEIKVLS